MDEQFEYQPAPEQPRSPYADSIYEQAVPVYQAPKKPKKKGKTWKVILALVLAAALIAGSSLTTAVLVNRSWEEKTENLTESMNTRLNLLQAQIEAMEPGLSASPVVSGEGLTPGQVYAKNVRAVVAVECVIQDRSGSYGSFGSGFVLTEDGYIVSNAHVVEGATSITVTTGDGREFTAQLVGSDATNDVALLKAEAQDLPCVELGSSDALAVGDQVMAIGNPLGELTSTLTVGYVSAKDRIVNTDGTSINMLQTDAAINSGNSGGPLFNAYGQVVGITTAKYSGNSSTGASIEGIGFAIPIDDVLDIFADLKDFGYVKSAYLGVYVKDVSAEAQSYGHPAGAYVDSVISGLAAEKAGIQAGDTITDLGGNPITNTADLTRALRKFEPGDVTTVTVFRRGGDVVLDVTLSEALPAEEPAQEETQPQQEEYPEYYSPWPFDFFGDFFG